MGVNKVVLTLNDTETVEPRELLDINISLTFGEISATPVVETEIFTFVNEAAQIILNHIEAGKGAGIGIFEGVPAKMTLYDQDLTQVIFDGFLDLTEDYEELEPQFKGSFNPVQIKARFVSESSLNNFETLISGVTLPYLESIGVFTDLSYTDVNFLIETKFNPLEVAIVIISIYTLEQAIEDTIARIAEAIATIAGILASGITGAIGAAIATIAIIAIELALSISLLALILKLSFDLVNLILSPIRTHKGTTLRTMLENCLSHFGYTLNTNLEDMTKFVYLPSRPFSDSQDLDNGKFFPEPITINKGIPKQGDFGYLVSEVVEIVRRVFNAQIQIEDTVINLFNENDPFFNKQSGFIMADILLPRRQYNTRELFQTSILSFITDPTDDWTTENYTGTAFEVKTDPIKVNDIKRVSIKGIDEINIPLALGTVKDKLNNLEKIFEFFLNIANGFVKAFNAIKSLGGKTSPPPDLSGIITRRIGMLKVGSSIHTVAKLLMIEGGEIPLDHRDTLSAKALHDTYYKSRSFLDIPESAQRTLFNGVASIPFTLKDFQKVLNNSNFTMADGTPAKFRTLEWSFMNDTATADIEVKEIYTVNLKETKIEA